jgi:hypothetical protein
VQLPLDGAERDTVLAWLAAAAGPAMGGVVATEIPPLRVTVTGHTPDPESLRRAAPAIQRAIREAAARGETFIPRLQDGGAVHPGRYEV